jgi:hypothetical protein
VRQLYELDELPKSEGIESFRKLKEQLKQS